jgi:hypothetical protein
MRYFLFAVGADNSMLGSERRLTADGGQMHDFGEVWINKI